MTKTKARKRWLSNKEAAEYLGCHPGTLAQDRQRGRRGIPFSRLGWQVRYDVAELDKYLEANQTVPVKKLPGESTKSKKSRKEVHHD